MTRVLTLDYLVFKQQTWLEIVVKWIFKKLFHFMSFSLLNGECGLLAQTWERKEKIKLYHRSFVIPLCLSTYHMVFSHNWCDVCLILHLFSVILDLLLVWIGIIKKLISCCVYQIECVTETLSFQSTGKL